MLKSAYVHIPFCKSKCHYCSFVSFCNFDLKKDYLKSLEKQIKYFYKGETLETLYIGGGTPSVLTPGELGEILKHFSLDENSEITVELNPDDVDEKYLNSIYDLGVNRLSFGCQTFDDGILKQINRRHSASQVEDVVSLAKNIGFKNVSLDFIYGLPGQSEDMFLKDLQLALSLGVEHISLYGLKIENGCYFYSHKPLSLPDDDTQADMYLGAIKLLTQNGFEHYEVSNFSRPGLGSRHNLSYWENKEYYGFGVGAHGYVDGVRYENFDTLVDYLDNPLTYKTSHRLTRQEILEEEIFLGLRKMCGIDVELINQKFGIDFMKKYKSILNKYEGLKLLEKTPKGYKLTPNGVLVSNVILADFID